MLLLSYIHWAKDPQDSPAETDIPKLLLDATLTLWANFQEKRTILTFSVQIWPKMGLGLEVQKTNIGIRINILEIPCVSIFMQNEQPWLFSTQICPKIDFGVGISKI